MQGNRQQGSEATSDRSHSTAATIDRGRTRTLRPIAPRGNLPQRQTSSRSRSRSLGPPPVQDLPFLNISSPDEARSTEARRFVRSQVNLMREHSRRKRRTTDQDQRDMLTQQRLPTMHEHSRLQSRIGSDLAMNVRSRSLDSTIYRSPPVPFPMHSEWPVPLTASMRRLMEHCMSPSFKACEPLFVLSLLTGRPGAHRYPFHIDIQERVEDVQLPNFFGSKWLPLAVTSGALLNAMMMISASHLAIQAGMSPTDDTEVILHRGQALFLLNEVVSSNSPATTSDATIACIALLSIQQMADGDFDGWRLHMEGMKRIIDLRGGMASFAHDGLVNGIVQWADFVGALFTNSMPYFPTAYLPTIQSPQTLYSSSSTGSPNLQMSSAPPTPNFTTVSPSLSVILSDLSSLDQSISTNPSLYPEDFLSSIRSNILYRLISLTQPSYPTHGNQRQPSIAPLGEIVRLATLAYSLTVAFHPYLPPSYPLLTQHVLTILRTNLTTTDLNPKSEYWSVHSNMLVWALYVGVICSPNDRSTSGSDNKPFFLHHLRIVCKQLEIHYLEQFVDTLRGVVELKGEGLEAAERVWEAI